MPEPLTAASLSRLDRAAFVAAVGAVFEHSPWVMERAWDKRPFASQGALLAALTEVLQEAGRERQRALIDAHPELAGKAAAQGELTADSTREQAGAGLNACSPDQLAAIRRLNQAYRQRFGWPFIVAVNGMSRQEILAAMARRLERTAEEEFAETLAQILRIAGFRLEGLLGGE
jgi:2-oxo-4-hydroxy-4-carboxy-5-ureidoimidazoline decarboxylase